MRIITVGSHWYGHSVGHGVRMHLLDLIKVSDTTLASKYVNYPVALALLEYVKVQME